MHSSQFPNFSSDSIKNNTLGDGIHECTYGSIPSLLTSLDSFFSRHSLTPDTTLAFQADNSLPSMIVLLWLLHHKFRFFLLPPTQANESAWESIPSFCSFLMRADESHRDNFLQDSPPWDRLLRVEENQQRLKGEDKTIHHPEGMMYVRTSGSMGKSKIVSYTLENLWGNARNCFECYGFTPQDRVMIPVPIFHLYGLAAAFLPAFMGGSNIELQKNTHLVKYLSRERIFHPNIAFLNPLLCSMLNKGKRDNTAYRLIVTSTQKIQQRLFETFDKKFGGCLVNQYGCSEMGAVSVSLPNDPFDLKSLTIGQAMPGVETRVEIPKDTNHQGEISENQGGLLFVRHPFGFSGYVDEEGTFRVEHEADQWYETGDWAVANPDGEIRIIGRADNQVNRSGYLVSLAEIESKISELPQISGVVVVALEEETQRGQTLVAVCVLDTEDSSSVGKQPSSNEESPMLTNKISEDIRRDCDEILPPHAVPDQVLLFPSLPNLPSGKVDLQSLKLAVVKKLGKQSR